MEAITRRTFAKGVAASAALLGIGSTQHLFNTKHQAYAATDDQQNEDWRPGFCVACHNPVCGTKVRVVDGLAVEIKGDPEAPTNQGMLCPRGLAVLGGLYHPYRVKTPLKRTNPEKSLDNDPAWVEISWDEALDTCTQKLMECKETDPRTLFTITGFGNEDCFKRLIFEGAFGTPNASGTSGPLCADHYGPMCTKASKVDRIDMEYCNYLLLIGRSIGDEWGLSNQNTMEYVNAISRGMKVVTVNPRKTNSAQTGEWVPITPGTDTAFCYAILHVMMHEIKVMDERFLKTRTNSPYLIQDIPETLKGTKCIFQDYERDPGTGKPLVWDESRGDAVPFDTSRGTTYALFGTYEVNGVAVKTCLQLMADYIVDMTPEWAEEITTVPATTIRKIAQDLIDYAQIGTTISIDGETFPFRPAAAMAPGRGSNSNPLNTELFKSIETVNLLIGNLEAPGGSLCIEQGDIHRIKVDDDGLLLPPDTDSFKRQAVGLDELVFPPTGYSLDCFYPHQLGILPLQWHMMLDPAKYHLSYSPKVHFWIGGGNPFRSNVNSETVAEALRKTPFVFGISLWFDEPTQFFDIILPENHTLERYSIWNASYISTKGTSDYSRGMRTLQAKRPIVEPLFNTRQNEDLVIEFARRTGCLPAMLGIANASFQGSFNPGPPGLGKYAFKVPEFAQDPEKTVTYDEFIERKLQQEFDGEGWDAVKDCAVQAYNQPTKAMGYFLHWHPEGSYRVPVYYSYSARSARMLRELCERENISFPGADLDEVLRQYSAAPVFFEFEGMHPTEEYPLKVAQFKTHFQVADSTGLSYNQWMDDVRRHFDPNLLRILIAPDVARSMGLKEGDKVTVESTYGGKTSGLLHLSEMIHPSVVGISGKWGAKGSHLPDFAQQGPTYNILLNHDERDIGFMMGNLNNSVAVKVYKA